MSGAPIYTATADERRLATDWHGGQTSMLYAVASTGVLSRGSEGYRRGRTDEEWSADLLADLAGEVANVISSASRSALHDYWVAVAWDSTLAGVTIELPHGEGVSDGE